MKLALFNLEGEHPRSATALARRFILWSIVCWISGGPSFAWAVIVGGNPPADAPPFDPWAMALGIVLFSMAYTALTSTDRFDAFQRRPGVRLTLYIGYFTRLGVSIAFPIAMGIDMLPGMFSVLGTQWLFEILGVDPSTSSSALFLFTFLTTCVQGLLLNILISIYMLVVYVIVRFARRGRPEPRGFEVIPTANPDLPEAQIKTP